jgi:hypothetical protein
MFALGHSVAFENASRSELYAIDAGLKFFTTREERAQC